MVENARLRAQVVVLVQVVSLAPAVDSGPPVTAVLNKSAHLAQAGAVAHLAQVGSVKVPRVARSVKAADVVLPRR